MKLCAICSKPLRLPRTKYCSDTCYLASKAGFYRRRYHADPAYAAKQRATVRAWRRAHREQCNATRRDWYARRKAAKFARVLEGLL